MAAEADTIPTVIFDSLMLPVEAQFDTFANHTRYSRVTRSGTGPFSAQARFWPVHRMIISAQTVDPFTMDRDEAYLQSTEPSHFLIVLPLDGRSRFTAPGIDAMCGAGDIIVANLNKLGKCENHTRQQTIAIPLSTAFLEEATGPIALHGRLPPSPETRLFIAFVRSLVDQLPSTSFASMVPLCRILRDLFANVVVVQPSADPASPVALIGRARAYIDAQPPGELNTDAIVAALGITRSTLYRLFKADGGVIAFDRLRRLRLLHRAIADPLDRRSLAALGYDHGFADAAHLARLFRKTFGYSMSDLRGHLRRDAPPDATDGGSVVGYFRDTVSALI